MPMPLLGKMVRILKEKTFVLRSDTSYKVSPNDEAVCVSDAKTFNQATLKDKDDKDAPNRVWYRVFVNKPEPRMKILGFDVDIPCDELGVYDPIGKSTIPVVCD
jgi:hypothetical protein